MAKLLKVNNKAVGVSDGIVTVPEPNLISKTITANGDYNASDDNADGYSEVSVNVPNPKGVIWTSVDADGYPLTVDARGLKTIEEYNFYCSTGTSTYKRMTRIYLPSTIVNIPSYSFKNCSSLTDITLPDSVTNIGTHAFNGCSGLVSFIIPNGVTRINNSVFTACSNLRSISIPNSVNYIDSYAFTGCRNLQSITIPNGVTYIGGAAISGCDSITSIVIPNSVSNIGANGLGARNLSEVDCTALTVTNGNVDTVIGGGCFLPAPTNQRIIFATEAIKNVYANATNWSAYASRMHYVGEEV